MKTSLLSVTAMCLAGLGSVAAAAPIEEYSASSLSTGPLSSWTPVIGSATATTTDPGNDPTVANTDAVFNGQNYVFFNAASGLSTSSALFSGTGDRSVGAVYATTGTTAATVPIAGESGATVAGGWYELQTRGNGNVVTGDPYLAGYSSGIVGTPPAAVGNDDAGNLINPTPGRLVFAMATYSAGTETLYWAYGNPLTHLTTPILSVNTVVADTLNTNNTPFTFGYDSTEGDPGVLELGAVQVYAAALTAPQVQADFTVLEQRYGYDLVPEPSTWAMMLGGLAFLGFCVRRKGDKFRV